MGAAGPLDRTELVGAVHVHTAHSDGSSSIPELAAAAASVGLDFVVIADHDTLGARSAGEEGWHGKVLVAVATEITTNENCHLLALGNATAPRKGRLAIRETLALVAGEGGRVLVAHPSGRGLVKRRKLLRDWPHWPDERLAGLEVWNYLQDWGNNFSFFDPKSYRESEVASRISGPPDWLLAHWDAEAERRPFAGIAASDNHAKRLLFSRQQFFPHESMLPRLVNRVRLGKPLSADGPTAARELFAALVAGRLVFAREELGSAAGFDFRVEAADGRALRSGDSAAFSAGMRAVVESPVEAELRICRRGAAIASVTGRRLEHAIDSPGAYRAEARLGGKHWAFSNHVRLT